MESRTAFNICQLYARRDPHRITCVGLDSSAARVYLGLDNGHMEEHQLLAVQATLSLRLLAEKRISKQPLAALACLSSARRVAVLGEDGSLVLCRYEALDVLPLPGIRCVCILFQGGKSHIAAYDPTPPEHLDRFQEHSMDCTA